MCKRGVEILAMACALAAASAVAQARQAAVATPTTTSGNAIVPRLIKFNGTLLDEQGHALKGPLGVAFSLYGQQSGGAALWMETQSVKPDVTGNYTVLLGAVSANGIPEELFASGEARWLGVQPEGQAEQPRVLLVSVPYALKAGDAQRLGGLPPSAFAPASSAASTKSASSSLTQPITLLSPSLATGTTPVATIGGSGTTNFVPLWSNSTTLGNSILFQSSATNVNVNGSLSLPAIGTATATLGSNSQPFDLFASSFNKTLALPISQHFRWQVEPVGNNTKAPSGKLNLLFASGTGTPVETGLSISSKGLITFAPGQTIPTVTGNETVTGNLAAKGSVSGASANFTGAVTTGNETVNGNVSATGTITGQTASFTGNNTTQIVNVTQNGTGSGLVVSAPTAQGIALLGQSTSTTSTTCCSIGVEGTGVDPTSYGVVGAAAAGGVEGETSNSGGIGVIGVNFATSGSPAVGVQGSTASPSGTAGEFFKQFTGSIGVAPALAAVSGGTSGQAALFFLNNASNPYDVLDLFLPFGSNSNLLQGFGRSGGSSFVVDANGNISTFGGTLSSSANVTINSSSFGGMALNALLGPVNITAGNAGPVNITAGSISAADPGGAVNITGGSGGPGGHGGNIVLTPGLGGVAAPPGTVQTPSEIRMGSEGGTSELPSLSTGYQDLVVRRINSPNPTAGKTIARTDTMLLQRNGTDTGFQIEVLPGPSAYSIACLGLTSTTTVVGFTDSFLGPTTTTTTSFFGESDLLQFNCTFGDTEEGHATEVNLLRSPGSPVFVGTVTSTFNQ